MASADDVVISILAKTEGFDAKMKQSASAFGATTRRMESDADRAGASVERSMRKIDRSFAQAAQRSRNLGYQISDIGSQLSVGTSPFVILAQQGPQVANALDGARGAVGKFATFLSGPWGAAALAATTILGGFLLKGKETAETVADLVEKLKQKAHQDELGAKATDAYTHSIEGQIEAYRKLNDEIENSIKSERTRTRERLTATQNELAGDWQQYDRAKMERDRAKTALAKAKDYVPTSADNPTAEYLAQLGVAQANFDKAQAEVIKLATGIIGATKAVRGLKVELAGMNADEAVDPIAAINGQYDRMREAAETAALGNAKLTESLESQLTQIEKNRQAALKLEQDRQRQGRSAGGTSNFIMPVEGRISSGFGPRAAPTKGASSFHNGIDIAAPAGTPVKAAQSGVVIHAGKLGGLGNVVIVDHGGGTITEYGHLSSVLAQRGQQVGQGAVIGKVGSTGVSTGPHLDYRVKVGGKYVDPRKGAFATNETDAATKAERAASEEQARRQRQQGILDGLNERYAAALASLAQGTEESAEKRKAAIDVERDALDAKIAADKSLDDAAKAEAKRVNDATAELSKELVNRAEAQRKFRIDEENRQREATVADALRQQQQDKLQGELALARTQMERRDIELKILALAIEEQRLRALEVIAARDRLATELAQKKESDWTEQDKTKLANANAQASIAQGTLNNLPSMQSNQASLIGRDTAGPIEQLFNSLPQTAQEISEAFEAIAANGLESLSDGIADAILGADSLKAAFKAMADDILRQILRMIIKMMIFRLISSAFGLGASGGGGFGGNIGDNILSGVFGLAEGGHVRGPGTGTSDSIPARLSNGEFVMRSSAVRKFGVPFLNALNSGQLPQFSSGGAVSKFAPSNVVARAAGATVNVNQSFTLDARHGITTPELLRHVNTVATEKATKAGQTAYDASRRALPKQIGNFQKLGTT